MRPAELEIGFEEDGWCAWQESNLLPHAPQACALSDELQARASPRGGQPGHSTGARVSQPSARVQRGMCASTRSAIGFAATGARSVMTRRFVKER